MFFPYYFVVVVVSYSDRCRAEHMTKKEVISITSMYEQPTISHLCCGKIAATTKTSSSSNTHHFYIIHIILLKDICVYSSRTGILNRIVVQCALKMLTFKKVIATVDDDCTSVLVVDSCE